MPAHMDRNFKIVGPAGKTGLPSISVCMMVKDEEANLARCLKSVHELADEIIVVDTGSKDSTVRIAESFGARIFHHPWESDFSKHRNQSISYATKDWVFILDADEELIFGPGGPDFMKQTLLRITQSGNGATMAAAIVLKDIQSGMVAMHQNTARLFRRGHIRYSGIVHNQPVMDSKAAMIEESVCFIKHYGYDLSYKEKQEKKAARTLPLILKWMEQEPDNMQPHFYLTQIYAERGDFDDAVRHGELYLKNKEKTENSGCQNFNKSIYYTMFSVYMKMNRIPDAERWLSAGIDDCPENIDMSFAITQLAIRNGKQHLLYIGASRFIELYDDLKANPIKRQNLFMFTFNPESYCYCMHNLALSQLNLGVESIMRLKEVAGSVNSQYRNGLMADLKSELMRLGLPELARRHIHIDQQEIMPSLLDELKLKNPEVFN